MPKPLKGAPRQSVAAREGRAAPAKSLRCAARPNYRRSAFFNYLFPPPKKAPAWVPFACGKKSPRIERGEGRYSRFARERRGARGEGSSRQIASLRRSPELPNVGASQLPLPTAKKGTRMGAFWWWEEVDSNYRSRRRQIYSLIHLAALESSRIKLELAPRLRWSW